MPGIIRVQEIAREGEELAAVGETLAEAIVTRSPKRRVIKRGRIVARDGVPARNAR